MSNLFNPTKTRFKLITEDENYIFLIEDEKNTSDDGYPYEWNDCRIVAYRNKDNNYLQGLALPLLPELPKHEEDVEQLALKNYPKVDESFSNRMKTATDFTQREAFKKGFKAASKKWSNEDMRKMYDLSCGKIRLGAIEDQTENNKRFTSFMEQISPKLTPVGFEPEYETVDKTREWSSFSNPLINLKKEFKIVNGVLQGTYKF